MIRVLVADDNPVIRTGLASLIDLEPDMAVVAEAGTGRDAVDQARTARPDVVLMDVRMPVVDGIDATAQLAGTGPRVLVLTYAEEPEVLRAAIAAGARGYLVHGRFSPEELTRAIRTSHAGGIHVSPAVAPWLFDLVRAGAAPAESAPRTTTDLTEREIEVVDLIATGRSNAEIATALHLSEKTVKNHINRAYAKLGVRTRAEAMAAWLGTAPR